MGIRQGFRIAAMALAVISLVFALIAWRAGGAVRWDILIVPVGLILLCLAMFVDPRRRLPYYGLLGASMALWALWFGLRLSR